MIFFFFSDIDGVLKSANGTEYGLASGVFTKDLSKVWFIFFSNSIYLFSVIILLIPCKERRAVEYFITYTLVNGQLYLRLPSQHPIFSTPIQTLYFYILISSQLQLHYLYHVLSPKGVRS